MGEVLVGVTFILVNQGKEKVSCNEMEVNLLCPMQEGAQGSESENYEVILQLKMSGGSILGCPVS